MEKNRTDIQEIINNSLIDNDFIPKTEMGTANGVATLDQFGKIPPEQLGEYIRGGIKIKGTMDGNDKHTIGDLISELETTVSTSNGAVTREEMIGYAWVASENFTLSEGVIPANTAYTFNPGDEGDSTPPINIEAGDMLLVSNYSFSFPTHTWTLSVINNAYGLATSTTPGIVKVVPTLTHPVDLGGLAQHGDKVVTADTLIQITKPGGDVYGTVAPEQLVTAGHTHSNYQLATNKAVDFSVVNDTKYPTTKAVKDLVDATIGNINDILDSILGV